MLTKKDLEDIGELIDKKMDDKMDKKLKPIYKILTKIQKDLNTAIDFFDDDVTDLKVRMDRVETRPQLPPVIAN